MKEGRKPEYPEKTPGDELQKMPPYYSPKIQAPSETRTPHNSIGGRLEKVDVLTVTLRVAPKY